MEISVRLFSVIGTNTASAETVKTPAMQLVFNGEPLLYLYGVLEIAGLLAALLLVAWMILALVRRLPGGRQFIAVFGVYTLMAMVLATGWVPTWGLLDYFLRPYMLDVPILVWAMTTISPWLYQVLCGHSEREQEYWRRHWVDHAPERESRFWCLMRELAKVTKPTTAHSSANTNMV